MAQLPQPANLHATVTREDAQVPANAAAPVELTENARLRVAVQFIEEADAWIGKSWAPQWREADILYQSLRSQGAWEGTQVTRANISRFTVAKLVNAIVPQLVKGIFYSDPPFQLRGFGDIKPETLQAKTAVYAALLQEADERDGTSVPVEVEEGMTSQAIFGPLIMCWGWTERCRMRKRYVRKREPVEQTVIPGQKPIVTHTVESNNWDMLEEEVQTSRPFLRFVDHRTVLFDPKWNKPDIRKCRKVGLRSYVTFDDLDEMREEPGFNIPSREELLALFFPPVEQPAQPGTAEGSMASASPMHAQPRWDNSSADPLMRVLEMVELWDENWHDVVLNRKCFIKSEANEFGKHPLLSCNWWNVPDSGHGIGLGRIVGQDQRVDTGVTNGCLDILAHTLNPDYIRAEGVSELTQNIRQRLGGVVAVSKDPKNAYILKEQPRVPSEALAMLQLSKAESESAAGANEQLVQGATPTAGRSSLGRTATGAAGMIAGSASRLEGPLERFVRQVFVPYLYVMDELVNDRLPSDQLHAIIGERLGKDFEFDEEEFRNASLKFEVLAGAHLAAKKAMAQVLPLLAEFASQPGLAQQMAEVNGEYVDYALIFKSIMEMGEWRYDSPFVKPLTPEMKQRVAAKSGQNGKFQQQVALENLSHQHDIENINEKAQTRAAERVMTQQFENAMEGREEPGQP